MGIYILVSQTFLSSAKSTYKHSLTHPHTHKEICASYGTSLRPEVLGIASVSCLYLKQENYTCGFRHGFLIFGQIWKSRPQYLIYKGAQNPLSLFSCHWTIKAKRSECFGDTYLKSRPAQCADRYLVKNTKRLHKSHFGFCILLRWQVCPRVTPWFSLSPLLLFHFLPVNGKTEITLLKSMALQGQSFCVGTSGKQEQQWLNGTLRDLEFHGLTGLCP